MACWAEARPSARAWAQVEPAGRAGGWWVGGQVHDAIEWQQQRQAAPGQPTLDKGCGNEAGGVGGVVAGSKADHLHPRTGWRELGEGTSARQ